MIMDFRNTTTEKVSGKGGGNNGNPSKLLSACVSMVGKMKYNGPRVWTNGGCHFRTMINQFCAQILFLVSYLLSM